jgi:WD40 repeat protein
MNADEAPLTDGLADLLAVCDDALAHGSTSLADDSTPLDKDLHQRVSDGIAAMRLLRRALAPPATSQRSVADSPNAPRRLGRFEIRRGLGHGACGIVYLAYDPQLRREVALKVPRGEFLLTPELRARFVREAQAAARLDHANVVAVHEVGEVGPFCYIASAYCPGTNLADWLRARTDPVPVRLAASLCATLASAVQHAHERGVLHRDLKPANVLLEPAVGAKEFLAKVTDFGLAKVPGSEESQQTQSGAIVGTPRYMAPEQAEGNSQQMGAPADVYALGVILYELLTGRTPFVGDTILEVLEQVRSQEPVSPGRLRARLPRDLETICLKCLQKRPEARYASAGQLAADLQCFLDGKPIVARPVRSLKRLQLWARRRPAHAALLVMSLVAAMALTGAVVALAFSLSLDDANRNTQAALAAETVAKHEAERQTERAEGYRYLNLIGQAYAEWRNDDVRRADELLVQCPVGLRGWEWHYLNRLCHADLLTLADHPDEVTALAYSPDGNALAVACKDGTLMVWDTATGHARFACRLHTDAVTDLVYTSDGKRLVTAGEDWTVRVSDAATGKELRAFVGAGHALALSGDDHLLASRRRDGTVCIWHADTGETLWSRALSDKGRLAFDPAGNRLAVVRGDSVDIWDRISGECTLHLPRLGGLVLDIAFSPDGRWLAATGFGKRVEVWEVATGKRLYAFEGHTFAGTKVAFNRGGHFLASASLDQTVRIWSPEAVGEIRLLKGHTHAVTCAAFSPNGKRIATGSRDRTVKVWGVSENLAMKPVFGHSGPVTGLVFTPDGQRLASVGVGDHSARVWDVHTAECLFCRADLVGQVRGLSLSPDGNVLAAGSAIPHKNTYKGGAVRVVDLRTGHESPALSRRLEFGVFGVAWGRDGNRLAAVGQYGTATVWDAATGADVITVKGHSDSPTAVAFSPDGTWLVTAALDGDVKVWEAVTGREVLTFTQHRSAVNAVAFSPDSRWLATAAANGSVKVWNATTGEEPVCLGGHGAAVNTVCFSPDGKRLASAGLDRTVRLWDLATGQQIFALKGHAASIWSVAFAPDGRRIASADDAGTILLWDGTPGATIATTLASTAHIEDPELRRGHKDAVTATAYSPSGDQLASASKDRTVQLWRRGINEPMILAGHTQQAWGVAFRRDGNRLAVAAGDHDQRREPGEIKVWDTSAGKSVLSIPVSSGGLFCVAYSPDGTRLAAAGWDRVVHVWNADTGEEQAILRDHESEIWGVAFSPDGRRLASASLDNTVRIWDLAADLKVGPVLILTGHAAPVWSVSFSGDGKLLASASDDGSIRVWDALSGKEIQKLEGHARTPYCVAFSPDGTQVASVGGHRWIARYPGEIRICDVASGRLIQSHINPLGGYFALAYSPDGQHLAAGSMDRSVQVWPLSPHVKTTRDGKR